MVLKGGWGEVPSRRPNRNSGSGMKSQVLCGRYSGGAEFIEIYFPSLSCIILVVKIF